MTSTSCPNNVWNHTSGCVCVANGSHTAEVTDIDLYADESVITTEMLTEALGDGPDLTDDEQRILGILLDQRNHEDIGYGGDSGEARLEEVAGMGDSDDNYSVKQIGELLYNHYERHETAADGAGGFSLTIADGESEAYSVGVFLGHNNGGDYLETHEDIKYLSNERYFGGTDTSGLRKAIKHASTIDGDFQSIRAKARRLGLVPDPDNTDQAERIDAALRRLDPDEDTWPTGDQVDAIVNAVRTPAGPRKSPWPENDDERAAFDDWKTEAGNGDTNASFRDWYENPDRNMDDED